MLACADTYSDDQDVQTVPQVPEVMQAVDADLQHLLHHVVEDEEAEDDLAQAHKVVPAGYISDQTHRLELPGRQHAASRWELHQQPDKRG